MRVDVWFHAETDTCYHYGKEAGLSEKQLEEFCYAGNEHKITFEVDEQGKAVPVALNDQPVGYLEDV